MSDVKRYVQTRNRDGDLVLTEDKGQNYLEWTKYILASDYDALAAENARLRALVWMAWNEFNAIRARSGSPLTHDGMRTVSDAYWSAMTDALAEAAGSTLPWPTDEMEPVLEEIERAALRGEGDKDARP